MYEIEFNIAWRELYSTLKIGESITISRRKLVPNIKWGGLFSVYAISLGETIKPIEVWSNELGQGIFKNNLVFTIKRLPLEAWVPDSVRPSFRSICIYSEEFPSIKRVLTYYQGD